MSTTRVALRSVRCARTTRFKITSRPYSSTNPQQTSSSSGHSPAIVGGLVGGSAVFVAAYGWYHFSGAKTAVNSIHQAKQYAQSYTNKLSNAAPEPNEALKWLRDTALGYAAFIPGGKSYVNSVFNDIDTIHKKHGPEVDGIVSDTYSKIKDVTMDKGMSIDTAQEVWTILENSLKQIGGLAGDAAEDLMNNHPDIKAKFGGNIDQLKSMGDKYGGEAKEQVDKTWDQIQSILSKGINAETANEIRAVVQEKIEFVQKMGDEAFNKAMDQAKPYLDKLPKAKELLEENGESLKQGNVGELLQKVKDAASSGNTEELEQFIKSSADKAMSKDKNIGGEDMESYLKMIPGADQIAPKLTQLLDIGKKHGKEAEQILKDAGKEIEGVLQRKVRDAQDLAEKAKKK